MKNLYIVTLISFLLLACGSKEEDESEINSSQNTTITLTYSDGHLTWNRVEVIGEDRTVDMYYIESSEDGISFTAEHTTASNKYTLPSRTNKKYYRVKACVNDISVCSEYSNIVEVPQNIITIIIKLTNGILSWDAFSGADYYQVEVATGSGSYSMVQQSNKLSYTTPMFKLVDRKYRVKACAYEGDACSEYSNIVEVPKNTISNIKLTNGTLSWDSFPGADYYQVEAAEGSGAYSLIKKITTTTFSNLAFRNIDRKYRVKACVNAGDVCSEYSNIVQVPKNAINNIKLTNGILSWDSFPGADYYQVEVAEGSVLIH